MGNDIFEKLVDKGVAPDLAAFAEDAALRPPREDVQLRTVISFTFWIGAITIIIVIAMVAAFVL
jgi:hypothetical protein